MNLRKVMINRWIPGVIELGKLKEGTKCYEKNFPSAGLFHQWANEFHQSRDGIVNFTFAIVEMTDGTIEQVQPNNMKFVDGHNYTNERLRKLLMVQK